MRICLNLEGVSEYINHRLIHNLNDDAIKQLAEDETIYFSYNENGDGTEEQHFILCSTSKKLVANMDQARIFHLDCTYKIVKYNYPLLIFGFTDIRRQFTPIAFAFVSHEQDIDFQNFFTGLIGVCIKLGNY